MNSTDPVTAVDGLRLEMWPIARLIPSARNARSHSKAQIKEIAAGIEAFGFSNPILIGVDGDIIAGHGRLAAARRLGLTEVPVIVLSGRLLTDIEARKVDIVVVYKIDRLSRALMDFAKLVEVFDRTNVTFVSVTQSFNTTTSMGRLTLNILLSFAQFRTRGDWRAHPRQVRGLTPQRHLDGRLGAAWI